MENAYYTYQQDVLDRLYPTATEQEISILLLAKLDEVLAKKDFDAEWLSNHYEPSVMVLFDGDYPEEYAEFIKAETLKEIEVFKKNGYGSIADDFRRWLDEYENR